MEKMEKALAPNQCYKQITAFHSIFYPKKNNKIFLSRRKQMRKVLLFTLSFLLIGMVSAAPTLTSIIGDKDGFGLGVTDGQAFSYDLVGSGDGDGTDVWMWGDKSWVHTLDLSQLDGSITSASLEVFHGGDGLYSASEVFINDVFVGYLSDAENPGNIALLDIIDLTPYISLIGNSNILTIEVSYSGDGWVLDYSELTVNSSVVPAPGASILVGIGLLTVRYLRNRKSL